MGDVELIRIRTEKAALALQDVRRPVKTSRGKQRRLNARLRGMAGLDALRRSARVVILHHAPRKAGGQADVDAFHKAGLAAGGMGVAGPVGAACLSEDPA